jgi:hypothetical protein
LEFPRWATVASVAMGGNAFAGELLGNGAARQALLGVHAEESPDQEGFIRIDLEIISHTSVTQWHLSPGDMPSFRMPAQPAQCPFQEFLAFILGDHALHVGQQLSLWGPVVLRTEHALQGDTGAVKFLGQNELVDKTSAEAVNGVGDDDVHLVRPDQLTHRD